MNCIQCDKVIEQVEGKRAKKYCSTACKNIYFRGKKADSAILAQKQGLENAPESATIDEVCNTRTVTPQKNDVTPDKCNTQNVTPCNTQKVAASNDNPCWPVNPNCKTFKDLPVSVQKEIDDLAAYCTAKHIPDDKQARIDRAIHYQQLIKAG